MKFTRMVILFFVLIIAASCTPKAPELPEILPFKADPNIKFGQAQFLSLSSNWKMEEVNRIAVDLNSVAREYDLPADLLAALCWYYSKCNETIVSPDGQVGLFQIMPSDGRAAGYVNNNGEPVFYKRPLTSELQVGKFNLEWGAKFLRKFADDYQLVYPETDDALQYAVYVFGSGAGNTDHIEKIYTIFKR